MEQLVIDGKALTFSRDALGRETRRQSEAGFKQDQGFDAASQLISQNAGQAIKGVHGMRAARDASVHKQAGRVYEYDRAFSPVKISDILGGDTSFAYDPNGQVTKAVNETTGDTSAGVPGTGAQRPTAANLEERFDYDAARNLTGASASAPDATVGASLTNLTRFQSTPGGVTQIARGPRGEKISLDHDECGRVIKRRVHRDGFRPQVWLYTWDVPTRTVCVDRHASEAPPRGDASMVSQMKTMDDENKRLKKMYAELSMQNDLFHFTPNAPLFKLTYTD